jgi:hypothetical protein
MRERTLGPQAWNQARTELARERAASARLDRQERERRVIPVDEVRACWTGIARVIRDRVLGLARKVAPRLAGLKSAAELEAILYSECVEALEELSLRAHQRWLRPFGLSEPRRPRLATGDGEAQRGRRGIRPN